MECLQKICYNIQKIDELNSKRIDEQHSGVLDKYSGILAGAKHLSAFLEKQ